MANTRFFILFLLLLHFFSAEAQQGELNLPLSPPEAPKKLKAYLVPAAFLGYGLVSMTEHSPLRKLDWQTRNELREDHPYFSIKADNYLQFSPALLAMGFHLSGFEGRHNMRDAGGLYLLSFAMMAASVSSVKQLNIRTRPDLSAQNSFPSGHTATAFAAAEFLRQEYKDRSPIISYAGYGLAIATGALRMYNNRHWASDVVAGAGFGILSTKLSYMLYPKLKQLLHLDQDKSPVWTLAPRLSEGTAGGTLQIRLSQ